jgi:hypothetical protein
MVIEMSVLDRDLASHQYSAVTTQSFCYRQATHKLEGASSARSRCSLRRPSLSENLYSLRAKMTPSRIRACLWYAGNSQRLASTGAAAAPLLSKKLVNAGPTHFLRVSEAKHRAY